MTLHIPRMSSWMRFVPVGYGIVLFIWMSLEDNSAFAVAWLGALFAFLVAMSYIIRHFCGQILPMRFWLTGAGLIGLVTGAGAALATALLMIFKNGWHAHLYPDFPPLMIRDMLLRVPAWSLAGLLVMLALALLRVVTQDQAVSKLAGK